VLQPAFDIRKFFAESNARFLWFGAKRSYLNMSCLSVSQIMPPTMRPTADAQANVNAFQNTPLSSQWITSQ
jgi:hypothetical protein